MLLRAQEGRPGSYLSRRSFLVGTGTMVAALVLPARWVAASTRPVQGKSSGHAAASRGAAKGKSAAPKSAGSRKAAPATKKAGESRHASAGAKAGAGRGHVGTGQKTASTRKSPGGTRLSGRRGQRRDRGLAHEQRSSRRRALARGPEPEVPVVEPIVEQPLPPDRSLDLYCLNTGERLSVDYCRDGRYQARGLRQVDELLRDHRSDEVHEIDPAVLDLLLAIRASVASSDEIHVVSGYRSPQTNRMRFLAGTGVAEHSYHVEGRAVDFFLPDRPLRFVHRAALAMKGGGVGYYPGSGFVHVDNGPLRYW